MGRIQTDDKIHRIQGKWIDIQGTEMPWHMTYLTWVTFLVAIVPCLVLVKVFLPFDRTYTVVFAICADIALTAWIRDRVTSDKTPLGFAQHLYLEINTYFAARLANARRDTTTRPARECASRVRRREN